MRRAYAGRHRSPGRHRAPARPIGSALRPVLSTSAAFVVIGAAANGYASAAGSGSPRHSPEGHSAPGFVAAGATGPASQLDQLEGAEQAGRVERSGRPEQAVYGADSSEVPESRRAAPPVAVSSAVAAEVAQVTAERQAAAERAARDAQRQSVTANAQRDPKSAGRLMLGDFGWNDGQFSCLDRLWTKESGWNYRATNSSSGAYGIPQSLPGAKMGTVAPDWRTNPVTQITWGLQYIKSVYGTPCSAWSHSVATNWY